jgi:hypothetical protein
LLEQWVVTPLQDDPATGGENELLSPLQFRQASMFFVSECRFADQSKNFCDRFREPLPNQRIGIYKTKSAATRDLPPDRRLSSSHESDQDKAGD